MYGINRSTQCWQHCPKEGDTNTKILILSVHLPNDRTAPPAANWWGIFLEGTNMNKYEINGIEFYNHFPRYNTWLEILDYLVDHEVIRRKKERGRGFFRNVSNDIIDGLVISKKCAASLLQDMSRALIQPPKSYDGGAIIPMPADIELLSKLTKQNKIQWKKRIGVNGGVKRDHLGGAKVGHLMQD